MLTEEKLIDQITLLENRVVMLREVTRIFKDGIEIAKTFHRWAIEANEDMTNLPPHVQVLCVAARGQTNAF